RHALGYSLVAGPLDPRAARLPHRPLDRALDGGRHRAVERVAQAVEDRIQPVELTGEGLALGAVRCRGCHGTSLLGRNGLWKRTAKARCRDAAVGLLANVRQRVTSIAGMRVDERQGDAANSPPPT